MSIIGVGPFRFILPVLLITVVVIAIAVGVYRYPFTQTQISTTISPITLTPGSTTIVGTLRFGAGQVAPYYAFSLEEHPSVLLVFLHGNSPSVSCNSTGCSSSDAGRRVMIRGVYFSANPDCAPGRIGCAVGPVIQVQSWSFIS